MNPEVDATVLGLSRTRMSPPRRRFGGTSCAVTFWAGVVDTGVTPHQGTERQRSERSGGRPAVERLRHRVLGLFPVRVVGPQMVLEGVAEVGVELGAARLVQARRDVAVRLDQV